MESINRLLLVLALKMVISLLLLQLIVQKRHLLRSVKVQIILWLEVIQMVVVMMVMIRMTKTQTKKKILFSEEDKNSPNQSKVVMINYQKIWSIRTGTVRTYFIKRLLLLELLQLDFIFQAYILYVSCYRRNF